MTEIIPIINDGGINTVNARDLHEFLEIGKDFSAWIKDRIAKYGFIDGEDFTTCSPNLGSDMHGGQNRVDYYLSIDMAKELSMVENNDQGRKARRYFIACEKAVKKAKDSVKSIRGKSAETRNGLTATWQEHGASAPRHFINLTRAEYKALGYENVKSVKKSGMSLREIAKLTALESLETMKLETRADIQGYYGLRDSIGETGEMLESFERKMIAEPKRAEA